MSDSPEAPVVHMRELAEELAAAATAASSGRESRTLPHAGSSLRQTLTALTAGTALDDHESPGSATLFVLSGTVVLGWSGNELTLQTNDLVQIPDARHRLDAPSDAVVLLTVAGQPVHD